MVEYVIILEQRFSEMNESENVSHVWNKEILYFEDRKAVLKWIQENSVPKSIQYRNISVYQNITDNKVFRVAYEEFPHRILSLEDE
jgi:hypothetical protein